MAKISETEEVELSKLKPYKKNAKIHSELQISKIADSISEFGFLTPILIDRDYNIIAGHGRVKAAQKLKMDKCPCVFIEGLSEAQRRAYILADNKLGELAEWDMDLVQEELEALNGLDFDVSLTGFDFNLDEQDSETQEIVEDEAPEVEEGEARTKRGDIYQLGRHRLMCGDSTSQTDVETLMGGCKADLLITDPPYNVDYTGKTKDNLKIQNDKMDDNSFRQFLRDVFSTADSVMKPGAVFYIWHAGLEGYNFQGACHDVGWQVRECLIWNKNSLVLGRQDYQWKHEPCLYGWKDGTHLWASDRKQTTVIDFDRPTASRLHPTMKPVGLFDYQIKNNTKSEDIVLDLFGGSGTTIMACEQNGRVGYSMELDPHYCDVIIKRWEQFTGEKAELLNGLSGNEAADS